MSCRPAQVVLSGPAAELRQTELIRHAYLGELQGAVMDGAAARALQGMRAGLASARPLLPPAEVICDRQ